MDLSHLLSWVSQTGTALRDLPVSVHAAAVGSLIAGIVLWFCGNKVLKPVIAVAGAGIGAALGAVIFPNIAPAEIGGVPSHYVGMAFGILVGIMAALIAFRFAMAVAGGLALGLLGMAVAAGYLSFTPGALPNPTSETGAPGENQTIGTRLKTAADDFSKSVGQMVDQKGGPTEAAPASPGEEAKRALSELWAELGNLWSQTPSRSRVLLLTAGLIGCLTGILIGQMSPNRAAAVLTSMAGSAMAMFSGTWLARAFDAPFKSILEHSPLVWLGVWAVAVGIGVAVQLKGRKKPEPTSRPA